MFYVILNMRNFVEAAQNSMCSKLGCSVFVLDAVQQSSTHRSSCSEKLSEEACERQIVRDHAHKKPRLDWKQWNNGRHAQLNGVKHRAAETG